MSKIERGMRKSCLLILHFFNNCIWLLAIFNLCICRKILNHKHSDDSSCYDVKLFEELRRTFQSLMRDFDDHTDGSFATCNFSPHPEIGLNLKIFSELCTAVTLACIFQIFTDQLGLKKFGKSRQRPVYGLYLVQ